MLSNHWDNSKSKLFFKKTKNRNLSRFGYFLKFRQDRGIEYNVPGAPPQRGFVSDLELASAETMREEGLPSRLRVRDGVRSLASFTSAGQPLEARPGQTEGR